MDYKKTNGNDFYDVSVGNNSNNIGNFYQIRKRGARGPVGPAGARGADGSSAYEVAVENGFVGTELEWIESLIGPTGATGEEGADGISAYEVAVENGFVGTETEWLQSLIGPQGSTGPTGPPQERGLVSLFATATETETYEIGDPIAFDNVVIGNDAELTDGGTRLVVDRPGYYLVSLTFTSDITSVIERQTHNTGFTYDFAFAFGSGTYNKTIYFASFYSDEVLYIEFICDAETALVEKASITYTPILLT